MKAIRLQGEALDLRPLQTDDIDAIHRLAQAPSIPANTFVPQPYPRQEAEDFVRSRRELWQNDEAFVFGMVEKRSGHFAGCIGLHPVFEHFRAEVGYWVGEPFQGRGMATEALRLATQFGFDQLKLNRIEAGHFAGNPASGRVMQKAGLRYEGLRRQLVWHRERFRDLHWYVILRDEYLAKSS